MRIKNQKRAYTLAEIMIVILILTIIFAAFAPMFTTRSVKNYKSRYNVWEWSDFTQFNAAATSPVVANTNELFFGVTPNGQTDVESTFAPLSKIVIRSGEVTQNKYLQRQIQFRYGRTGTTDPGKFAGTWFADGKNILLGGTYHLLDENDSNVARNNTAIGYNSFSKIKTAFNNVAVGYNTLSEMQSSDRGSSSEYTHGVNNVAVGYQALLGANSKALYDVAIGANAGKNMAGTKNIAIGFNSASGTSSNGNGNTYIGAYTAASNNESGENNVAIGYRALTRITTGKNNIAIGANAGEYITTGSNNTAIGANACLYVGIDSNKTCIGANSGPYQVTETSNLFKKSGAGLIAAQNTVTADNEQRTYIGSKPKKTFPGDAVLEIHNVNVNKGSPGEAQTSPFSVTTIVNGNLIVRGRPYFTVGQTLHHFHDRNYHPSADSSLSGIYDYSLASKSKYLRFYGYSTSTSNSSYQKYYDSCASGSLTQTLKTSAPCLPMDIKTSDRRLKDIGSKYTAGLDKLRELKVYNYTFKKDENKEQHVGVIAQELKKVFPNSVFKGEDGYFRIRWDEMFYAVLNGIKEIDKRIVALVKYTTNIETQISKLEKENTELKVQVDSLAQRVNKLKAQ